MELDWSEMFSFSVSPFELIIRGTIIYWFIFFILRAGGRRDVGSLGVADMLVLVLIADAAQNGMAGEYRSVTDGMVLIATIVGWTVIIDRVTFFFPGLAKLLILERVCLVRDGELQRRNLRREYITVDELMAELRLKGVERVEQVRRCYVEADGNISVLRRDEGSAQS